MIEPIYFPLGTRCSSAGVIGELMKKRNNSYPFDWIDTPLFNVLKFLQYDKNNINEILLEYFAKVDEKTFRHEIDNTWFPHDFPIKEDLVTKYVRRFNRMYDLFDSNKNIVFLTVLPHFNESNIVHYDYIKKFLDVRVKGKCTFISVNVMEFNYFDNNHINFSIPLGNDWGLFHKKIHKSIGLYLKLLKTTK